MRFYKQILKAAELGALWKFKRDESLSYLDDELRMLADDGYHVRNIVKASSAEKRLFLERVRQAKIFVIDISAIEPVDIEDDAQLDLPFQTCSFEPAIPADGAVPLIMIKENATSERMIAPAAMIVHELSPGLYDIYALNHYIYENSQRKDAKWTGMVYHSNISGVQSIAGAACFNWLQLLQSGSLGVEIVKERRERGSRSERKRPIIRQIIRVVPRRERGTAKPLFSRQVDWSHRWTVRGHWRKIDDNSLGKNRQGEYCVYGRTWVQDFEKGPQDAPLIANKIRVFASSKKEDSDG